MAREIGNCMMALVVRQHFGSVFVLSELLNTFMLLMFKVMYIATAHCIHPKKRFDETYVKYV